MLKCKGETSVLVSHFHIQIDGPESIHIIEFQAFYQSYYSVPSSVSKLSLFLSLSVCRHSTIHTTVRGGLEGRGKELNHTTTRKPGPV